MAQSNYTPILLYCSGTSTNVPLAANLEFGELALNYADGKLFYKDAGGVVQQFGAGGSGTVTSVSVVSANGLAGTVANATTTPAITLSTSITGILQGNGTAISAASTTGTGNVVLANTPTLVTPILGTPTSGTLTSCTGLPISTGVSGLGTGVATFLATPTSANLAAAVTDETGSGALVFGTNPTLASPNINVIDFDTAYATALTAGQLGWDGNNTLGLGMFGGNVVQHIGEDTFFYVKASSAITKGQVCMFTGAVGASGVITAAPATGVTNGQFIVGVAAEDIANNGFGLIQNFGELRQVDTTAFADGDVLYYNSAVTGGFTNTFPATGAIVTVAAVSTGGSANGVIQIRVSVTQRITASTGISVAQTSTGTVITNTAPSLGGTVTSVAQTFTGGLISVAGSPITSSGTLALTVAGTSGGIPYFSSGTTWASSSALAANELMIGGGAGAAPSTITTGTGVVTALGVNTGSAGAFVVNGGALGTPSSGVATNLTGTATALNIGGNAATVTNGVYTTDTGTVTNTMLAGSIANAKLVNSSLTVNGTLISLGGSGTITAANPNALTIGTGLSGTSYDGSAAVTIANTGVLSFSAGTTGLTPNTATTGAVTLGGTLVVGNGGTGVSTLTGLAYGNGTSAFTAASAAQVVAVIGTTAVTNATNAANVTIGTSSTNANFYLTFVSATTGNLAETVNSGLTYNPSTNAITGGISGGGF